MQSTIYQNKDFILIRKPHSIPSTFGKAKSFLDYIEEHLSEKIFTWTPLSTLIPKELFPFVSSRLGDFKEAEDKEKILHHQVDTFGQDQEFGLVNRLDNETAGFLYFAKSQKAFDHFKSIQKSGKVKKFYMAQVEGKLGLAYAEQGINFPIMHHRSNPEKMIAIHSPKDLRLGRSKEHLVSTKVDILHYDPKTNVSIILATITRGIRHQIRVHLAGIGHPIIGDILYGGKKGTKLHLRSLGFSLQ